MYLVYKNTHYMQIIFDRWSRGSVVKEAFIIKRFTQLEDFIIRLDQSEFTEITAKDTITELYIGGGNDNYAISVSLDGTIFDLINEEKDSSRKHVSIVIAGEQLFYSPIKIVSVENALMAAEYYYEHRAMDPTMKWKKKA